MKKELILILAILAILIEAPIWLYMMYWLIKNSNPDRLIWFLFLAYIPIMIVTNTLSKIILNMAND